jgi:hypothetical protein
LPRSRRHRVRADAACASARASQGARLL